MVRGLRWRDLEVGRYSRLGRESGECLMCFGAAFVFDRFVVLREFEVGESIFRTSISKGCNGGP